jgi:hypothetical protein
MWKWNLDIENRIALSTLLKQCRGNYAEMKLVDKILEDVMSKDERKELNLRVEDGMLLYNTYGTDKKPLRLDKDVTFGPEARNLITRNLLMLNEANELDKLSSRLYELFILTPWPDPVK